ncbi:UDP-glucose 4-epimerase GalE [Mycoplasmatota bacterium WC44]
MNILVSGGAGFIGSFTVDRLIKDNHNVVVVDSLINSNIDSVNKRATFYKIDIRDKEGLTQVFRENEIDVVLHFAALISAPESMDKPYEFFSVNTYGTLTLLEVMNNHGVKKIVFSSTAAVYGLLDKGDDVIFEDDEVLPINIYGESKLQAEKIIEWSSKSKGIDYIIFRYFNVAGHLKRGINPIERKALIPSVMNVACGIKDKLLVYGDDYNTKDGSCIRDYIHVDDLVNAHVLGCSMLVAKTTDNGIYNLGNGHGNTVFEVINTAEKVIGIPIPYESAPRRVGDPVISVASSNKAKDKLGWIPSRNLEEIINDEWKEIKKYKS